MVQYWSKSGIVKKTLYGPDLELALSRVNFCFCTTILAKVMWDMLAECNASTIDRFLHGTKRSGGGGGGRGEGANIAGIRHTCKRQCPTILARIVESLAFFGDLEWKKDWGSPICLELYYTILFSPFFLISRHEIMPLYSWIESDVLRATLSNRV